MRAIGYWLDIGGGSGARDSVTGPVAGGDPSQVARQVPPDSGDAVTAEWFAGRSARQIAARHIAARPGAAGHGTQSPPAAAHELLAAATHVGWGTIRLESVFMQLGEAAGFACALARETRTAPSNLDPDLLLRRLVAAPMMVGFFNDFDMATVKPWVPAVQYLGTRGFFADYDARPDDPLSVAVAEVWARACSELLAGSPSGADADRAAMATARAVHRASAAERLSGQGAGGGEWGAAPIDRARFVALLTAAACYRDLELPVSQLATAGSTSRDPGGDDSGQLCAARRAGWFSGRWIGVGRRECRSHLLGEPDLDH